MSGFYAEGLEGLLARTIPAEAVVMVMGVNEDYTYAAQHSMAQINPDFIILSGEELSGATYTDGVLDGDDAVWYDAQPPENEALSAVVKAAVIYFQWGVITKLLAYMDEREIGVPSTLSGANFRASWSGQGILKI